MIGYFFGAFVIGYVVSYSITAFKKFTEISV